MKQTISIDLKTETLSLVTNIAYANVPCWYNATRRDLHMDLIIPKQRDGHKPCPVVLWCCGGAFMVVNQSVWMPELVRFARAGYVVASVEYRTSNEAQFPAPLIDVKAAVRYLRAHAGEFCIDPDHIYIMGESAGGTMASLVGTTGDIAEFEQGDYLDQSSSVQGVVDFYGLVSIPQALRSSGPAVPYWAMDAFLGADYSTETAKKASAVAYVSAKTPPFMILHGLEDSVVSISQSRQMHDALEQQGIYTEYLELVGASHGDPLFYQDEVIDLILAFLNKIAHTEARG